MSSLVAGICEPEPLLSFARPPDPQESVEILERIRGDLHAGQRDFVDDTET